MLGISANCKQATILFIALLLITMIFCSSSACAQGFIGIGSASRLNTDVAIPVTINNIDKLYSGQITITAPSGEAPVYYQGIEFTGNFDGSSGSNFTGYASLSGDKVTISFVANGDKNYKVKSDTLCYISYRFAPDIPRETALKIEIDNAQLQDQNGSSFPIIAYPGHAVKNYRLGDALGNDTITPASATLALRHANNIEPITDQDALQAMDLNANGEVDVQDATLLLNHIVGLQESFFTIKNTTLPPAIKGAEYSTVIEGAYGDPPYSWKRSGGQLPKGLTLDPQIGELNGKPSSNGNYSFTVQAMDVYGLKVERQFNITVNEPEIATITGITDVGNTSFKVKFDQEVYSIAKKDFIIKPSLTVVSATLSKDHLSATVVTAKQKAGTQYEVDYKGSHCSFTGTAYDIVTIEDIGDITMAAGETLTLPVSTNPDGAVLSTSGADSIATLTIQKQNLVITAQKAGSAKITVSAGKGGYNAGRTVFKLTVEKPDARQQLVDTITAAGALHDDAVEGKEAGQYKFGAKAALQEVINIAKGVLGQESATQEEIEMNTNQLTIAMNVFKAAISSHIVETKIKYAAFMNIHTIEILASRETNHIIINKKLLMHYEGNDIFSLATTSLNPGDTIQIDLYDRFSSLIESKYLTAKPTNRLID
jgi:hypothetical protein